MYVLHQWFWTCTAARTASFLKICSWTHSRIAEVGQFLGAFTKLRNATFNLVMSVRPSARNNSAPTGRIFMKFDIWTFSKISQEISVFIKTWREQRVLYMKTCAHFWSCLPQFFLEWKIFQTKLVENLKTHILCSIIFFRKSCRLWDSFIHSVICLTTGPTPLPKRFLHTVRSRASSFKW